MKVLEVFRRAFRTGNTYSDSKPLFSKRHLVFVGGIKVEGSWLELRDAIWRATHYWSEDCLMLRPGVAGKDHEALIEAFDKLFLEYHHEWRGIMGPTDGSGKIYDA